MNCLSFSNNRAVIHSTSPEDTRSLGFALGNYCYPGLTLMLYGTLGMGKTLLTQGIGDALGCRRIKSPTFIILAEHKGRLPMIHADLYRLDSPADTDSLDLENYLEQGSLLVIEWAEHWKSAPTENRWDVRIEPVSSEDTCARQITIEAVGETAGNELEKVIKAVKAEKKQAQYEKNSSVNEDRVVE